MKKNLIYFLTIVIVLLGIGLYDKNLILNLFNIFNSNYSLSGWIIFVLAVLSLFGLISLIRKNMGDKELNSYKKDEIDGVIWKWKWKDEKVTNLWSYCPTCDAELVYDDSSHNIMSTESYTFLICENCDCSKAKIKGGNKAYVLSKIEREIHRRLRVKERDI